jgi:hypothetical protein
MKTYEGTCANEIKVLPCCLADLDVTPSSCHIYHPLAYPPPHPLLNKSQLWIYMGNPNELKPGSGWDELSLIDVFTTIFKRSGEPDLKQHIQILRYTPGEYQVLRRKLWPILRHQDDLLPKTTTTLPQRILLSLIAN